MKPLTPRQLVGVVDRAEEGVLVVGEPDGRGAPGVLAESAATKSSWIPGGDEHAGGGRAVLAGVEVARDRDALDRRLDVGVVEDHDRGLAAELEVDALEVGRRAGGDLGAGADRAGDGDHGGGGVLDEQAAGLAVAGDDVEGAGGQELRGELGEAERALRRGVARLEHHGVAGREGRPDLPHRHQQRVVPRRHLADDADRLAPHPRGVPGHVLAGGLALEHPGRTGEEPELVDHRGDLLARGERLDLAGVLRLEGDQLLGVRLDRVRELQQRLLALAGRRTSPLAEGAAAPRRRPRRPPRRR